MKIQEFAILFLLLKMYEGNQTHEIRSTHCKVQELHQKELVNCSHHNLPYIPMTDNKAQRLIFGYNDLTNVTQFTFENISNPYTMIILELDHNKIRNISADAFDAFTNLKILILSYNPIYYDNLKNLLGALSRVRSLTHLGLSGIWTVMIQSDLFSLLKENQIETLEINLYSLEIMSMDIFKLFGSLKAIYLRDNLIETLKPFTFKHLHSLYIDHNQLKKLPDFSVDGNESKCYFPNLTVLNVHNNNIHELLSDNFRCLQHLKRLRIGKNPIKTLPNNVWTKLTSLQSLSLVHLNGGNLEVEPFAFNSTSLRELHIVYVAPANKIFISLSDTFAFSPNLKILNIGLINLLYLTNTQLSLLFSPTKLETFECYSCQLSMDPKYVVNNMTYVTKIDLRSNLITTLSDDTFKQNKHLRYLNLRFNEIGHIKESALPVAFLNKLYLLDLSRNPFVCDCDLDWLITWMKTKKNKTAIARYPREYACAKPLEKHNVQLSEINFTYKECHPWSLWIWFAIIASPCVIVLGFAILILYRNRWNIKHYIFLIRKRRNYQRIQGDIHIYDAFVAYEATDSKWVRDILLPVLEDDVGLKLCIHERDFQAGAFINDNIVSSIDASKQIIVILTNAFAQSGWCMFELKVAHSKLIEDETELVVILLERIDARNMNHSLKVLFATTTYIEWTEDEIGQALFWAKLKGVLKR